MHHSPRPFSPIIFSIFVIGILSFTPVAWAQTEDKPAQNEKAQTSSAPQKPVHKPHTVITNDSIVRLADRSSARPGEPPLAGPTTPPARESTSSADDAAQRKAEMASLEKLIKEKRQRVELLMRLFVTDEKAFLKDPLNPNEDSATQERRRYEQDELRWEGSEVARLQARLDTLKAIADK